MNIKRKDLLVAIAVSAGLSLNVQAATAQQNSSPLSSEKITQIVASPDRSAADRTNDLRRKPEQMLGFIGIRPGIVALDLSAAGGYTTELLARAIGPSGTVYGQSRPHDPNRAPTPPCRARGQQPPGPPRLARCQRARRVPPPWPWPNATGSFEAPESRPRRSSPSLDRSKIPLPPELAVEHIDLVTLMFNYHDLGLLGVDRADDEPGRGFRALKPGGLYVIADHSGRPGSGISESGTLHRIEEAFLRQEVEAAGFRLLEEGNFLRNPDDPRDKNTPDPPQPKDEFVLKFVKP